MLPINVPASQRKPLGDLANQTSEAFDQLMGVLQRTAPATSPLEIWRRMVDFGRSPVDQVAILIAGINLRQVVDAQSASPEAVTASVAQDGVEKGWLAETAARQQLEARLPRLLELPVVTLTSKAWDLSNSSPHAFDSSRILTDVRPLFSGSDTLRVDAAIIMHTLKIVIRDNDDHYTSMTSNELRELQSAINRAIHKEEQLRQTLGAAGVTLVDDEPFSVNKPKGE